MIREKSKAKELYPFTLLDLDILYSLVSLRGLEGV